MRIIYKADGTFRSDGQHVVRNWIGHYEHFFDVVFGRPSNYHVKPLWSKRYLKVGHNWIPISDNVEKNKEKLIFNAFLTKMVYNFAFRFGRPRYTMEYHVVSTKLSKEEHEKFLEFCNKKGCSTSELIKNSLKAMMEPEAGNDIEAMSLKKLKKELGL